MAYIKNYDCDVNKPKGDYAYELDETATNPDNYIQGEIHTVASSLYDDYHIVVPEFAPFFTKDIRIRYKKTANTEFVDLEENVDYTLGLYYKGATRTLGIPVYGCILIKNLDLDGILVISYRTLGGDQLVDRQYVLNKLIDNVWNPREKMWEYITDTPNVYPPEKHIVDWENITKLDDLIKAMDRIVVTIADSNKEVADRIEEFLNNIDVPRFHSMMRNLETHSYTDLLNQNTRLHQRQQELEDRLGLVLSELETIRMALGK